jgi:hypothetical protein
MVRSPLPFAVGAAFLDDLSRALACGACAIDGEKSLLIDDLATAAARLAGDDACAFLGARAVAGFAIFLAGHANFRRDPSGGFLERERHVVTQVSPALDAASASASAAPARAKKILKAEELAENVVEILENRAVEVRLRTGAGKPRMAIRVINLPLLNVAQDAIGLRAFAEAVFRLFFILRAAVRVPLEGSLPVRRLDFLNRRRFRNAEHFVVIALVRLGHIRCCGSLLPI